jgi:DNA-binding MarR family transcriptional regulator
MSGMKKDKRAYDIDAHPNDAYLSAMPKMKPTLGFVLHDVARLLRKRFEQRARNLGLTRSQWQVLAHLSVNAGIQQSALADILEIEPITLCRILDKLEATGLIERSRHNTDRRIWLLHVTEKAAPLLDHMSGFADLTRGEALSDVTAADQEILLATLTRMRANLILACARPVEAETELVHG